MNEKISAIVNLEDIIDISQLTDDDGDLYSVWKISTVSKNYILKKAKEYEAFIYENYLYDLKHAVPTYYGKYIIDNECYILYEYVDGASLNVCDRNNLIKALDSLIFIQKKFWNSAEINGGYSFDLSLSDRLSRFEYLNNMNFSNYYHEYIKLYKQVPRTLCNDDLLPFNFIVSNTRAVVIDWEFGGILPYLSSFVRFIAHCRPDKNYFLYMSNEDKIFAIKYYYDNLVSNYNIKYDDYLQHLFYFLIYEYSEWIYVEKKYNEKNNLSQYYQDLISKLISDGNVIGHFER